MAKNITEVRLLAVPLENDYLHTLYFASKSDQETYFKGKTIDMMENCTYQRKDSFIRYNKQMDDILQCNYVMYKNPAYSDKWFYAFVTRMEYRDEGRTDIYIETDVIQTWLKDYTVKPSFVEREHCEDDTAGLHTVPEGLESGDYVIYKRNIYDDLINSGENCGIVVGATVDITSDGLEDVSGGQYCGVYSGIKYYYYADPSSLNTAINKIRKNKDVTDDCIVCIFMAPYCFLKDMLSGNAIATSKYAMHLKWKGEITKPSKFGNFTPNNKKLFTYPYSYINMSNGSGANAIYKYEMFNNLGNTDLPSDYSKNDCQFDIAFALTPGCSIRLEPMYYGYNDGNKTNNNTDNPDEGLNLGKFPVCNWTSDHYTNWLTQNGVNVGVSVAGGVLSVAGGIASMVATGGASAGISTGMVMGGLSAIAGVNSVIGTIGEVVSHDKVPPQAQGNTNNGDVIYSGSMLTYTAYQMGVKEEYARIIDNFFDMFGYKTNRVKTPAKNHRKNYWYTKTIDCNIDGAIPMDDLRKIKDCYNRGITFWKTPANIGNYSVDNSIV